MIANCSAQKASELLTQKPDCQLIDVREYPEYAAEIEHGQSPACGSNIHAL